MADFWATLSIWTAGGLALLTFLDWVLRDQQKKWLTDRSISLFVWLDDHNDLAYLKYLGRFRWQRIVVILYAVLALGMALVIALLKYVGELKIDDIPREFFFILIAAYLGSFLGNLFMVRIVFGPLFNWITKAKGRWAYIGKSILALFTMCIAYIALLIIADVSSKLI